jgi:plasmid replication initiation protein
MAITDQNNVSDISKVKSRRVTQGNYLIEACYKMTLEEKRLVMMAISQINPQKPVPPVIQVRADEFARVFPMTRQGAYIQLREAADRLFERELRFKDKDDTEESRIRWVGKCKYVKQKAYVEISFIPDIHPYLSMMVNNLTSYGLDNISELGSIHSVRLFEALYQYLSVGKRFIGVSDLREKFGLTDKYPKFSDLRKYVIEPSVEEINAKSNLDVKLPLQYEKKGKVITRIWFEFSEKKQSRFNFV